MPYGLSAGNVSKEAEKWLFGISERKKITAICLFKKDSFWTNFYFTKKCLWWTFLKKKPFFCFRMEIKLMHLWIKRKKKKNQKYYIKCNITVLLNWNCVQQKFSKVYYLLLFLFSGVIDTDLHRHMYKTWYGCICWPFHKFFVKTPYFGAQTTLYCCLSDGIINGSYYSDCRQKRPSMRSLDDRACKKLWDISEKLTGLRSSQSEML